MQKKAIIAQKTVFFSYKDIKIKGKKLSIPFSETEAG